VSDRSSLSSLRRLRIGDPPGGKLTDGAWFDARTNIAMAPITGTQCIPPD
jgi:hypothetical protein